MALAVFNHIIRSRNSGKDSRHRAFTVAMLWISDGTLSATSADVPLNVKGIDTTSPNGSLPEGNVSMSQIMGLMNGK